MHKLAMSRNTFPKVIITIPAFQVAELENPRRTFDDTDLYSCR